MTEQRLVRRDSQDILAPSKIDPEPSLPVHVPRADLRLEPRSFEWAWWITAETAVAVSVALMVQQSFPLWVVGLYCCAVGFHLGLVGAFNKRKKGNK